MVGAAVVERYGSGQSTSVEVAEEHGVLVRSLLLYFQRCGL